jgi:hypothetical protein
MMPTSPSLPSGQAASTTLPQKRAKKRAKKQARRGSDPRGYAWYESLMVAITFRKLDGVVIKV